MMARFFLFRIVRILLSTLFFSPLSNVARMIFFSWR